MNGAGLAGSAAIVPAIWRYASSSGDLDRQVLAPWFMLLLITQMSNLILALGRWESARAP
jgi:hypothetical protein